MSEYTIDISGDGFCVLRNKIMLAEFCGESAKENAELFIKALKEKEGMMNVLKEDIPMFCKRQQD